MDLFSGAASFCNHILNTVLSTCKKIWSTATKVKRKCLLAHKLPLKPWQTTLMMGQMCISVTSICSTLLLDYIMIVAKFNVQICAIYIQYYSHSAQKQQTYSCPSSSFSLPKMTSSLLEHRRCSRISFPLDLSTFVDAVHYSTLQSNLLTNPLFPLLPERRFFRPLSAFDLHWVYAFVSCSSDAVAL